MYRVLVHGVGDNSYSGNGLTFDNVSEADRYGYNLLCRWFGADRYVVVDADLEPDQEGHWSIPLAEEEAILP